MPDRPLLQRAANVARLLGDTEQAEQFERAELAHANPDIPCPADNSCLSNIAARDYLAEHTDGSNTVVLHIGPTDEQARLLDHLRITGLTMQRDRLRRERDQARADLVGRVSALAVALGTEPDDTPTGGLYRMCQDVVDMRCERDLLLWLHAEAVHKLTLCGAVGYWGARNTRYECDKPKHHPEKEHENRSEAPPVIWIGHHPEPEICAECKCVAPFHKTCCNALEAEHG